MTSNKTEYSVMLKENDIHITLSLPPFLMPLIFISFCYNHIYIYISQFDLILQSKLQKCLNTFS